jgi:predicted enzyme related to lactoylglutathione lyase
MIKGIAFTAYPSKSVQSTREWYEKHLGLKFTGAYVEEGVEQYNETTIDNGTFGLMNHEWIEREPGSGSGVAFEVDNIEDLSTKLRTGGVTVSDVYETPVCKVASFNDPEGNKITLHQVTVPH